MLTIFAFVLIFVPFNQAAAANGINIPFCGNDDCSSNNPVYYDSNSNQNYQPIVYNVDSSSNTPIIYSHSTAVKHVTTAYNATTTNTNNASSVTATVSNNSNPTNGDANSYNGLAANAVYGGNGFLPTGLLQWLLLAIFVLVLIILARLAFGAKKTYHEAPLKHA